MNSRSGGYQGKKLLGQLDELLKKKKFSGHAFPLEDLSKLDVANVFEQHDLVVLAGGDGTIANLLPQLLESRVKTAVIPLGTGNDLARELNILHKVHHRNAGEALELFSSAESRPLTVWQAQFGEDEPILFCNYLSLGFDAKVISVFAGRRGKFGWLSSLAGKHGNRLLYGAAALESWNARIPRGTKILATLDTGRQILIEGTLKSLLFSNIAAIMGLGWVSSQSNAFDETLELNVITSPFDYARMMTPFHLDARKHEVLSFKSIELEGLPAGVPVQSDGEDRGLSPEGKVRVERKGSVNLCVL